MANIGLFSDNMVETFLCMFVINEYIDQLIILILF